MLERIDLNQKIPKKEYKKVFPRLRNQLFALQKASWDAELPVIIQSGPPELMKMNAPGCGVSG